LDFPAEEKNKNIDRLAIIRGQKKLLKQRWDSPIEENIENMDRLAIIRGHKNVKATVRFSS